MTAPYTAKAVANEFLARGFAMESNDLSPMKLQKLIYFAHGWNLAINRTPLINENLQAWPFGPVVPDVYSHFKSFGNKKINKLATELDFSDGEIKAIEPRVPQNDLDSISIIDQVWDIYGRYDGIQLSNMTHEEGTPWKRIADQFENYLPKNIDIPDELIQEYFSSFLQ